MTNLKCPSCGSRAFTRNKHEVTSSPKAPTLDDEGNSHNHGTHSAIYTKNLCSCGNEFEVFSYEYCCEKYTGERLIIWDDKTKIEKLNNEARTAI